MKQIISIALLTIFTGIFSSCTDWLDQKSYSEVGGNELYQTESGAQEALNGLYLGLAGSTLYGGDLTVGLLEALSMHYSIPADHKYEEVTNAEYNTSASKSTFLSIWKGCYKLIAECNVFLTQIEQNQTSYDADNYKLLRGEAIALRTFLHFDLFRMFAPAWSEENKTQKAIPYYNREVNQPLDYMTCEEIVEQLLEDVDEAIALLAKDPILGQVSESKQEAIPDVTFWNFRNFRFNIYAAYALKARICLHAGDKISAYAITTALLKGRNPEGESVNFMDVFPAVTTLGSNFTDPLCYTETLFGMHDFDREDLFKRYFSTELQPTSICAMSDTRYGELFKQVDDIRRRYFVLTERESQTEAENTSYRAITKWQYKTVPQGWQLPYRYQTIPLIRKAEIFLMAAESSDNDTDKQYWLEELRLTRGFKKDNVSGDVNTMLQEEYERELYAEGQYFYFLKRNGITKLKTQTENEVQGGQESGSKMVSASYYVLPIPEEETNNRIN